MSHVRAMHRELLLREMETGKIYVADFRDKRNRPVVIMRPHMENTHDYTGNILHMVYQMDRAISTSWDQRITVIMDLSEFSISRAPAMKTTKETVRVIQTHFVETLSQAILFDPPWVFSSFFGIVRPLLHPDTRKYACR